ncbi:MAG: hypothetical protein J6S00_00385 [Clostridia bacterium]|nr:hypothetical protein [Clostridia bacterium]
MKSKAFKIIGIVLGGMVAFLLSFLLLFTVFPWLLYPLEKDVCVIVQDGDMVTYDELREAPNYVTPYDRWFYESMSIVTEYKLKKYMKENNLAIYPGEYCYKNTIEFEEIIEVLKFQKVGNTGDGSVS